MVENMPINLRDTTFIIPVRIESDDREFNFRFVVQWLLDHLDTNIIIREYGPRGRVNIGQFDVPPSDRLFIHTYERDDSDVFHRTRILNEMLALVKTPVTVNYDCDILLNPQDYADARDRILAGADLVYPYFKGESQRKIEPIGKRMLKRDCDLSQIPTTPWGSVCGHCQFFNTESYRAGGMENENFISYGPEDTERMMRFQRLGYRVEWMEKYIYHIEHSRGQNSNETNPHFKANDDLYRKLGYMCVRDLKDYYTNIDYLKKYVK